MIYIAKRMQQRPPALQVAVEWVYDLMHATSRGENMDQQMATK